MSVPLVCAPFSVFLILPLANSPGLSGNMPFPQIPAYDWIAAEQDIYRKERTALLGRFIQYKLSCFLASCDAKQSQNARAE